MKEKRFRVTLKDIFDLEYGIMSATFVVVAESAAEAEEYVRQFSDLLAVLDFEFSTEEIPTGD